MKRDLVQETWRPAVGFEDLYEVSDLGRVRRALTMFATRGGTYPGKILACSSKRGLGRGRKGTYYRAVNLSQSGRTSLRNVHLLVCTAFHGPAPFPAAQVRHGDGDKLNNRADNLSWGTAKQNGEDRVKHGHAARGVRHGQSKLTHERAQKIRELYVAGWPITRIARESAEAVGVRIGTSVVYAVVSNRSWRTDEAHVD